GPLLAETQEVGKVRWIGVLRITPDLTWMEALRGGLRDLGYVEGQQIGIIDRLAEEKSHRLPDLAAEVVRLKVDVIVPAGPVSTRAAKQATSTIPIVMAADHSPVEDGFVQLGATGRERHRLDHPLPRAEREATCAAQGGHPQAFPRRCPVEPG